MLISKIIRRGTVNISNLYKYFILKDYKFEFKKKEKLAKNTCLKENTHDFAPAGQRHFGEQFLAVFNLFGFSARVILPTRTGCVSITTTTDGCCVFH